MPRSLWNGTVAFGQVSVPVKLYSAVQSKTVSFREVHLADGARIEHRRFCTEEDEEIPYAEVVKGFEVAPDEYVVLSREEVKAAAGRRTKIIDVEHFVPVGDIDPVFFDRTYFLGAQDKGADAYRLLHAALKKTGRAAAGRFVFHNREYWPSSARWTASWPCTPFKRIRVPRQDRQPSPAPDLMAALKRSLEEARQREAAGADGKNQGDLASLTKEELYERAQDQDIPGRSKMSKEQLLAAISG